TARSGRQAQLPPPLPNSERTIARLHDDRAAAFECRRLSKERKEADAVFPGARRQRTARRVSDRGEHVDETDERARCRSGGDDARPLHNHRYTVPPFIEILFGAAP